MPVALISINTSPALGPSSFTVATSSGLPAPNATAARTSIEASSLRRRPHGRSFRRDYNRPSAPKVLGEGDANQELGRARSPDLCVVRRRPPGGALLGARTDLAARWLVRLLGHRPELLRLDPGGLDHRP